VVGQFGGDHLMQEADVDTVLHQIGSQIVLAEDRAVLVDSFYRWHRPNL
jgi:hypothetical protein